MQKTVKLKKYNPTIARLWDAILSMSESQQEALLKQADQLINRDQRGFVRKSCHLPVDFATSFRAYKGFIKNISQLGVFIEAQAPIIIGEEVRMVLKLGGNLKDLKIKGEIAHATRWGMGVEFTANGSQIDQQLKDLISRIR